MIFKSARFLLVVFYSASLSGCGIIAARKQAEQRAQATSSYQDSLAECRHQYPEGTKEHVAYTKCTNQSMELLRPFVPYQDLLDQDAANRMALAERLQTGKITAADANQQWAAQHSMVVAEEQRRMLASRSVGAQESAAAAAWRASAPISCTRVGNTTNCY